MLSFFAPVLFSSIAPLHLRCLFQIRGSQVPFTLDHMWGILAQLHSYGGFACYISTLHGGSYNNYCFRTTKPGSWSVLMIFTFLPSMFVRLDYRMRSQTPETKMHSRILHTLGNENYTEARTEGNSVSGKRLHTLCVTGHSRAWEGDQFWTVPAASCLVHVPLDSRIWLLGGTGMWK